MELDEYIDNHCDAESVVLQELTRETHIRTLRPRMLSGRLQGRFLKMLCELIGAKRVLEIGTFTGYAAISMAEAMPSDGKVITIDINDELEELTTKFIDKSGLKERVEFLIGDACNIVPSLNETFDLVFIDADKRSYSKYFDIVFDYVRPGGLIVADDVLWSGKVLEDKSHYDAQTQGILDFNEKIVADDRVEKVMLPVRHGLYLIRKR